MRPLDRGPRVFWAGVTLAGMLAVAGPVDAQSPPSLRVSVEDLTVEGRTPPSDRQDQLTRGLRPTLAPIVSCYRERAAEVPGLRGSLRLRAWVSARRVIRVTPEGEGLPDDALRTCALAHVRAFRLPPEAPSAGAMVRFTLRFARGPRTRAAPPGRVVAELEQPLQAPGAPAPATVTRAVAQVLGDRTATGLEGALPPEAFAACAVEAGDLVLSLTISSRGRIRARRVGGSIGARTVERCASRVLRAVELEPHRDSARARLTLTFRR